MNNTMLLGYITLIIRLGMATLLTLMLIGCGSKLRVISSTQIGRVTSADCINGGWGSMDKTIIKTERASVPVRWCRPVPIGGEAWLTFYQEQSFLMDNQCWLYTEGKSYNCNP